MSYLDPDGREQEQPCRVLVLACGVVETPRLLLNSASGRFPAGLANSSGLVGRYFTAHITRNVYGRFPFPIQQYRGFDLGAVIVDAFQDTQAGADFVRGYVFEATATGPVSFARSMLPLWGQEFTSVMRNYEYYAGWWIIGEAMPLEDNTITLDPEVRDQRGLPVARVTHRWDDNDLKLMEAATEQAIALLDASGAVDTLITSHGHAHLTGTCRMGANPSQSVVNGQGQSHDIPNLFVADGSVFVTGGSVNNTLTSIAVATHVADSTLLLAGRREL